MPKRYACVKKITFVNFWFRQLCQYGGWVCCSNERVKRTDIRREILSKVVEILLRTFYMSLGRRIEAIHCHFIFENALLKIRANRHQ